MGYKKLFALCGTENVMGFGKWRVAKNYKLVSKTKDDFKLSNFVSDRILPSMDKDIRNNGDIAFNQKNKTISNSISRYLLYIRPEDTHNPYMPPRWCSLGWS